jgi:hypothetical protein
VSTSIVLTNGADYKINIKQAFPCQKTYGDTLAQLQPGESYTVTQVRPLCVLRPRVAVVASACGASFARVCRTSLPRLWALPAIPTTCGSVARGGWPGLAR